MVKLGMSPMEAIRSATLRPAEMLEMPGEIGVIAPGAYADVIALDGDPAGRHQRARPGEVRHAQRLGVRQ